MEGTLSTALHPFPIIPQGHCVKQNWRLRCSHRSDEPFLKLEERERENSLRATPKRLESVSLLEKQHCILITRHESLSSKAILERRNAKRAEKSSLDYLVAALSPLLIMLLVGSLVFFLIEVFYRGEMTNGIRWVMFWFVLAIVLVARIGIEQSPTHAAIYGAALAAATWLFLIKTHPAYLFGILLLTIVWWSSHKLVNDCTLIDDDADSTGVGLTSKSTKDASVPPLKEGVNSRKDKKKGSKNDSKHSPGRWVLYYALATLPLFGLGQIAMGSRDASETSTFPLLITYLLAATGLLLSTSFLGLRRHLRQRSLKMPGGIAIKWITSGAKIAALIFLCALLIPRPGVGLAWSGLSGSIDHSIQKASALALKFNPAGTGKGQEGSENNQKGETNNASEESQNQTFRENQAREVQEDKNSDNEGKRTMESQSPQSPPPLRWIVYFLVALVVFILLVRYRKQIAALLKAIYQALLGILQSSITSKPKRIPKKGEDSNTSPKRKRPFKSFRNPFGPPTERNWSNKALVAYTFEALEAWAERQGTPFISNHTPLESVRALAEQHPKLRAPAIALGSQYSSLAYASQLTQDLDIDKLRKLWEFMERPHASR